MSAALAETQEELNEAQLSDAEMCRLGLAMSTGQGGQPLDYVSAHKWFNLAAMRGSLEARAYRAEVAQEMTSDEIAEAQRQARAWLLKHGVN
ncbi:MAG: sel1 repeat family protein [Pseudomonadota bacterium]